MVDHVGRLGARRDVDQQTTLSWVVRVADFHTADDQRRADLVPGNLVDTISQPSQVDTTDRAGMAVVIFDADNKQTTIDGQGREILCEIRIDVAFPDGSSCLRSTQCVSSSRPPAAASTTSDQVAGPHLPLSGPR
jgi:hypothetical protein